MLQDKGFTLLELMVSVVIFAMLALLGWQIFDGLNKAKDTAGVHAEALSEIQYAYLQIHNDLNQVVAWTTPPLVEEERDNTQLDPDPTEPGEPPTSAEPYKIPEFFKLTNQSISFIRFADPDPRFQTSPTLIRVEYMLKDSNLIRKQNLSLDNANETTAISTTLLSDIKNPSFKAFIPEPTNQFSSQDRNPENEDSMDMPLLPKGVSIDFTYKDSPINWRFALPEESPAEVKKFQEFE